MPKSFEQLATIAQKLEKHYGDMQDIEFTIEDNHLYLLQTRNGKRTSQAALQIAVDLVEENIITKEQAIKTIEPTMVSQVLHPIFESQNLKKKKVIAKGLPASPGAASGKVYFDAITAKIAAETGEQVILIRQETSPEDIEGMVVSQAIVTSRGGMTSYAAVVARGMGTCCVVGCANLKVDEQQKVIHYSSGHISQGDEISVDGSTGKIYLGTLATQEAQENTALNKVLQWTQEIAQLKVRANADTVKDLQVALSFGADGIGLTRTEHMFFSEERIIQVRKMILATSLEERQKPLSVLLKMQQADFMQIYRLTKEKPVTVRLLDPPLHEFLPHTQEEIQKLAQEMNRGSIQIQERMAELTESNPMLGHRGCRLAVTYPEIYEMQVEAIITSALALKQENIVIQPEIMIPLIGEINELIWIKKRLENKIKALMKKANQVVNYTIGTMIETPRACITAEKIATEADFFSFGTNDLTQLTFGFSRDDAGTFINEYLEKGIFHFDPFQTLDIEGVGSLLHMAVAKSRKVKPALKIGVCGETGGDPKAIAFFQKIGLNYVSCSPFRIPVAKIAAAQAAIELENS